MAADNPEVGRESGAPPSPLIRLFNDDSGDASRPGHRRRDRRHRHRRRCRCVRAVRLVVAEKKGGALGDGDCHYLERAVGRRTG